VEGTKGSAVASAEIRQPLGQRTTGRRGVTGRSKSSAKLIENKRPNGAGGTHKRNESDLG